MYPATSSGDASSSRPHSRRKQSSRPGGNKEKDQTKASRSASGSSTRLPTPTVSLPDEPVAGGSLTSQPKKKDVNRRPMSSKSREGSAKPVPPPKKEQLAPPPPPLLPLGTQSGAIAKNDDFVGFGPGTDDEADEAGARDVPQPSTSAAPMHGSTPGPARKRKAEDISRDDGYANRKLKEQADMRRTPWAASVDWQACHNVAQMLHEEVGAFVDYITPMREEHAVREMLITLINTAVRKQWPDAVVAPFGSYETKLYLPTGDIDLVVQSDLMAYSPRPRVLSQMANVLRQAHIATQVQVISKAKVPIIKFVSAVGRLPVDISINQMNGLTACRIVNSFIHHLPALKPLVLIVKAFLSQRGQNEVYTGGLGSYTVVCMVISFLQMQPKIRRGEIDPTRNLGVLLLEFFELYGRYFNYEQTGISLHGGGMYFNKMQRGWDDPQKPFLFCVEDPQDSTNDIGKNSHGITRVRKTLAGAYEILANRLIGRHEEIWTRNGGRRQRFDMQPEDASLLVSVMGVTPEVIRHRRELYDIYRSGVLQRQLRMPADRHFHWTASADVLKPGPVPPSKGGPRPRRTNATETLLEAVSEMSLSDGEGAYAHTTADSQRTVLKSGSEDDSRYTRKGQTKSVYVADSDDGSGSGSEEGEISAMPAQPRVKDGGEIATNGISRPSMSRTPSRMNSSERQRYWASKSGRGTPTEELSG